MFEFELTPIELIPPWGEPPNLSLHWFGLTDGKYRIKVGDDYLLNYSDEYLEHTGRSTSFVEYQVVRLWEDILEMLPAILEPVPEELHFLLEASAKDRNEWYEKAADEDLPEEAVYWLVDRELDCGYLTNAPQVTIWSTETDVILSWNCGSKTDSGYPVWSATRDSFRMSRNDFLNAVTEFDSALMSQMKDLVDSVVSGWKSDSISIDLSQLLHEQEDRSTWLANYLRRTSTTRWSEVVRLLAAIQ